GDLDPVSDVDAEVGVVARLGSDEADCHRLAGAGVRALLAAAAAARRQQHRPGGDRHQRRAEPALPPPHIPPFLSPFAPIWAGSMAQTGSARPTLVAGP